MSEGKARGEKVKAEVVDDLPAAQAEAEGWSTRTISFADEDWEIPASIEEADIDALASFERASATDQVFHILDGLEMLLGSSQYRRLKAAIRRQNGGRFTGEMLRPLMESVMSAYGFEVDASGG